MKTCQIGYVKNRTLYSENTVVFAIREIGAPGDFVSDDVDALILG